MIRRINIFAGAGAGKTTLAGWLFTQFKMRKVDVELVQEFAKILVYEEKPPVGWDQWIIWNEQMKYEYRMLRENKVQYTISDSPLFLASCYGEINQTPGWELLQKASDLFDEEFPPFNIFLERVDEAYTAQGRWQDLAGAKKLDAFILSRLLKTGREFHTFSILDMDKILDCLIKALRIPKKQIIMRRPTQKIDKPRAKSSGRRSKAPRR